MKKVLFIGGPGNISLSTINTLNQSGFSTAVFTLPKSCGRELAKTTQFFTGDRNDPSRLRNTLEVYKPDVVLDFVCFEPGQARMLADLSAGRIEQYIFVSTCDVYGYPLSHIPMRETDPWAEPVSAYAKSKRDTETVLKKYSENGRFALTIIRPSYSMGNNFVISAFSRNGGMQIVYRMKKGLPVISPGDGNALMHPSCAYDTGRMIAKTVGNSIAYGQDYTCAGRDTCLTYDGYLGLFAQALHAQPNIVHIPTDFINQTGIPEVKDCLLNELAKFHVAFSTERFQKDFPDFQWKKTLSDAVKDFIACQEALGNFENEKPDPMEEKLLKAWAR